MTSFDPLLRPARPDDAPALAELVDIAGEGLAAYIWDTMRQPGESVWDVGRRRARREEGSSSYRNATVAEIDGRVAACLVGYALADEPEPIPPDMPAMFRPLQELENLAPSTWYVNVLAAYPGHRGRGLGARMLALAGDKAAAAGLAGNSIIVSDGNPGAMRLYRRQGYVERATRPMVKESWANPGSNWILMTRDRAAG